IHVNKKSETKEKVSILKVNLLRIQIIVSSSDDDDNAIDFRKARIYSSSKTKHIPEEVQSGDENNDLETSPETSFKKIGLLITPEVKVSAAKRRPAINSRAQEVTK